MVTKFVQLSWVAGWLDWLIRLVTFNSSSEWDQQEVDSLTQFYQHEKPQNEDYGNALDWFYLGWLTECVNFMIAIHIVITEISVAKYTLY